MEDQTHFPSVMIDWLFVPQYNGLLCTQYSKDTWGLQPHFDKVGSFGKVPITVALG